MCVRQLPVPMDPLFAAIMSVPPFGSVRLLSLVSPFGLNRIPAGVKKPHALATRPS